MGYYFEKAKSLKDLNPEQQKRYKTLRSKDQVLSQELLSRFEVVKEYIGPLTSGEIISALEELVEDIFVTWILAGEDLTQVEWVDPKELAIPKKPLTEEEKRKANEWWKKFEEKLDANRKREEQLLQLAQKETLLEKISYHLWWKWWT